MTQNILDKSSTLIKSRQNHILSGEEIRNGTVLSNVLDIINRQIQDGGAEAGWCDNEPTQCGKVDNQVGGIAYCDGQLSQCGNFSEEALSACKYNQTGSGEYYFTIPTTQYQRFINQLITDQFKGIKITKSGIKELQYSVENRVVEYLSKINIDSDKKVFVL